MITRNLQLEVLELLGHKMALKLSCFSKNLQLRLPKSIPVIFIPSYGKSNAR